MGLSVVVVTEQRLSNLTNEQVAQFRAAIPAEDRCGIAGQLTRAAVSRYVRDETEVATTDPETGEVETSTVSLGLGAVALLDDGVPYGLILYRKIGSQVSIRHWYVPLGRLGEVRAVLMSFARERGITKLVGIIRNPRVRDACASAGASVNGTRVEWSP